MSLRDQLQSVYEARGRLTPDILVEEAQAEDHPLHDRFEWDDAIAGDAYRRDQAQRIIRSVRVVTSKADSTFLDVRAFHAVRDEEGYAYHPTEEVLADPLMTKMVLADMEREWRQLKARYEHFKEFRLLVLADMEVAS